MLTPHVRRARRRLGSFPARAATVAATVLALVLTLPGAAVAAPGDLDPTFSGDGKVLTDFGYDDNGNDVAVQPDGKIVTVGSSSGDNRPSDFALTRHNPDGTPDRTFGIEGGVTTDTTPVALDDWANAVALQPDGKIVVVGTAWRDYENCCWFVVARYNADGSLDPTFSGDGIDYADIPGPNEAYDVAIDSQNRIVAAGFSGGLVALTRYLADGTPDTSFGGDGVVTADPSPDPAEAGGGAETMAIQPDGKIVVGGDVGSTRFDFMLMRFHPDGGVDGGFGTNGIVRTDFGGYERVYAVAVQPDGRIVAAGTSDGRIALARYSAAGALDTGFDGDGRVLTADATAADMVLQPDGRILTAGGRASDFALLRYNTDGSLDGGFGTGGRVITDFGGADTAHALKLDAEGRIVVAGTGGANTDFALARYLNGAGTPPPPTGADLSVTKTGTTTMSIGSRATYTVTVTNNTAGTSATGVTLTDTLTGPAGSVISVTTDRGSCTTNTGGAVCNLGTLAPGTTGAATVRIVVEPRATGTLTDRATVTSTTSDPMTGNNTATKTTTVDNARGCTRIGTSGNDTLTGTYGNDVICALSGDDTVNASYGNDTVYGDYGNDRLDGSFNDDRLVGGPGNDTLTGNYGNDRLETFDGVSGNDTANGGSGSDTCTTDSGDVRISCP